MARKMFVLCAATLIILLMTAGLASAGNMQGKILVKGFGSYSFLNPLGFNQVLDGEREHYESGFYFGPDSGTLKALTSAVDYGGEIRYYPFPSFGIGGGWKAASGQGQINWDNGSGWTGQYAGMLAWNAFYGSVYPVIWGGPSYNVYGIGGLSWNRATITRTASDSLDWIGFYPSIVYQGIPVIGYYAGLGLEYFIAAQVALAIEAWYSRVPFGSEWTIIAHPVEFWVGQTSSIWTHPVQAGGITVRAELHFYLGGK